MAHAAALGDAALPCKDGERQWLDRSSKAPGFGDRRKAILEDIAILTGGTNTHRGSTEDCSVRAFSSFASYVAIVRECPDWSRMSGASQFALASCRAQHQSRCVFSTMGFAWKARFDAIIDCSEARRSNYSIRSPRHREQVRRHRPWARDQSEMMGGDITVASEPSKGSMFTVRLPVGASHPDQHSG